MVAAVVAAVAARRLAGAEVPAADAGSPEGSLKAARGGGEPESAAVEPGEVQHRELRAAPQKPAVQQVLEIEVPVEEEAV